MRIPGRYDRRNRVNCPTAGQFSRNTCDYIEGEDHAYALLSLGIQREDTSKRDRESVDMLGWIMNEEDQRPFLLSFYCPLNSLSSFHPLNSMSSVNE